MLGVSRCHDVSDLMEKRVRSRFSSRKLVLPALASMAATRVGALPACGPCIVTSTARCQAGEGLWFTHGTVHGAHTACMRIAPRSVSWVLLDSACHPRGLTCSCLPHKPLGHTPCATIAPPRCCSQATAATVAAASVEDGCVAVLRELLLLPEGFEPAMRAKAYNSKLRSAMDDEQVQVGERRWGCTLRIQDDPLSCAAMPGSPMVTAAPSQRPKLTLLCASPPVRAVDLQNALERFAACGCSPADLAGVAVAAVVQWQRENMPKYLEVRHLLAAISSRRGAFNRNVRQRRLFRAAYCRGGALSLTCTQLRQPSVKTASPFAAPDDSNV